MRVRSNIICPEESACHIRRQLNKTLEQKEFLRNDIWSIDKNAENLDNVISDAAKVIKSEAFLWFERFENFDEVTRTVLNNKEEPDGTFCYGGNYLIGYISLANGDFNLAASSLEKVVDYENFKSEQLTNDYKFALAQNKSTEE